MKPIAKFIASFFIFILGAGLVLFLVLPLPGDVPVLMYHFIDTSERARHEGNVVSRESFARQMAFLKRFGYRVITLDQLYEIKTGKRKPRGREIAITFDDGNYTFADQALPILKQHGIPAAVFLVSRNVQGKLQGSMSEETVRAAIATGLVTIGSHSQTHPLLSQLGDDQILTELTDSKKELESMFGVSVNYLAYPSGDLNEKVLRCAKESGYLMAFSTSYKKLKDLPEGLFSTCRIKISRSADLGLAYWGQVSGIYGAFKRR